MTRTRFTGSPSNDIKAVNAVLDAIAAGHRNRDAAAAAIAQFHARDALTAHLAQLLMLHEEELVSLQTWLDDWDGPVVLTLRDLRFGLQNRTTTAAQIAIGFHEGLGNCASRIETLPRTH